MNEKPKSGPTRGNGLDTTLTDDIPEDLGYAPGSVVLDPHTGEIRPDSRYRKPETATPDDSTGAVAEVEDTSAEEQEESELHIPYNKFIENVDGYLTGYLYAKQEYEKLESERKPNNFTGKKYQDGFDHKRWEQLSDQKTRISAAFRGLRERALAEKPELQELFDQFSELARKR